MTKTVVFILSTSYAGSHYLSLMLGSHSRAMHVGEVERLRKPRNARIACLLCGPADNCPVFRGITPTNVEQAYDLFFDRFGSAVDVLVDNSKIVDESSVAIWAERFVEQRSYYRKYIHLIRDPRALVRRWMLAPVGPKKHLKERWKVLEALGSRGLGSLLAAKPAFYTYRWLAENQAITDFIRRHRLDAKVVTYEDLAMNPAVELRRLVEWIGLPYESSQIEYWNFQHHGSQKLEYEWVKEQKRQFIDTRWKDFLPQHVSRRIASHAMVSEYLTRLGLVIGDDGIKAETVSAGAREVSGQVGPAGGEPGGSSVR